MSRAALIGAWVAAFVLPSCLDTSAVPPPAQFPCPDGTCPAGFACSRAQLCVPSTVSAGSSGTGSGTSGGASGTTSGSTGGTTSSQGQGTTGGGSSGGGSSSGGTSGGAPTFAGEWDMNFAHLSLTQDGGSVTGQYRDWGYSYLDPTNAGTLSGTAVGNVFAGTFQDTQKDPAGSINWTLAGDQLDGTYQLGTGQPQYPWCGVLAGQGTPLPIGCGWSDGFIDDNLGTVAIVLQQVGDEVSGSYSGGVISGGVVSGLRVNLQYAKTGANWFGRFSWWMTPDGTQFSGNYVYAATGPNTASCAYRNGTPGPLPTQCLGGGGFYDGTWFTNFGTVTLIQPQPSSSPVSGIWFGWGSDLEYTIDGGASGPAGGGPSTAYALSWTDDSPLGGAVNVVTAADGFSNALSGQVATDGGGLWCGVAYGVNPFVATPLADAGKTGTLSAGCGLTSDQWLFWQPSPSDPNPIAVSAQLVQNRGTVTGFTNLSADLEMAGTVTFPPPTDAGSGARVVVTGRWTDLFDGGSGVFTWYPDSQDQTFSGDFTFGDGGAAAESAWCGSLADVLPSPCLQ